MSESRTTNPRSDESESAAGDGDTRVVDRATKGVTRRPQLNRNIEQFDLRSASPEYEYMWQRRKIDRISRILAGITPRQTVADVGCGSGFAGERYLDVGVGRLEGFDVSRASLDEAAKRGILPNVWNVDGDPCPREDALFDVVIAGDVIEHVIDTDLFVRELRRIVRPEGRVIVSTPNLASWYNRLRLLQGKVPAGYPGVSPTVRDDMLIDNNHIRVNTMQEWSVLFRVNGLEPVLVTGWSILQVVHGGVKPALKRLLGRAAENRAQLAENLIFVLKPS